MITLRTRTVAVATAAFLAFAALATVAFVRTLTPAGASHKFNDVGTGTFFHHSTARLKEHDIADGFGDGTFRTGATSPAVRPPTGSPTTTTA